MATTTDVTVDATPTTGRFIVVTVRGPRLAQRIVSALAPPIEPPVLSAGALAGLIAEAPVRPEGEAPRPVDVPSFDPDTRMLLHVPLALEATAAGFEVVDHAGEVRERLGAAEVAALPELAVPGTLAEALERHEAARTDADEPQSGEPPTLTSAGFEELARRLWHAGVLEEVDDELATRQEDRATSSYRLGLQRELAFRQAVDTAYEAHEVGEAQRRERTGVTRTAVLPVLSSTYVLPLALGMVIATARQHDQGRLEETFDFHPRWLVSRPSVKAAAERARSIFLFSNYVWDHGANLERSSEAKAANPLSLTVHGGPDTPKYPRDSDQYFAANPHVDITVHGEGELTFAEMLAALEPQVRDGDPDQPIDLSALADVPGLSYRHDGQVVHTADRDRITDFEMAPSPFATDVFDAFAESGAVQMAIIESNRGCPYGCTYCDWGSATASRIRKIPMQRIHDEIEWCARNHIPKLTIADANFGIWARDVEIAEKIAEHKATHGYPQWFATNYAKNTVKHLRRIVEVMLDAGIHTEGLLSLQSMDSDTLEVIRRSNIKLEKYEALAKEFRKHEMPLFVDLMLGLPGQTTRAFRNDLQECIEREVTAKVFPTQMLVNSPMNDPAYRTEHRIQTDNPDETARAGTNHKAMVVSSASFTREDYDWMLLLRRAFVVSENYGVLRQISRFVRQETGIAEVDLISGILDQALADPQRWPYLAQMLLAMPDNMTPPVSWARVIDELSIYLQTELGIADTPALQTALAVQLAVLPSRDRSFPFTAALDHDFAAWHDALMAAKDEHLADWVDHVPQLAEFPPAEFTVDDPNRLCRTNFGFSVDGSVYNDWELASAVSRPMPAEYDIDL